MIVEHISRFEISEAVQQTPMAHVIPHSTYMPTAEMLAEQEFQDLPEQRSVRIRTINCAGANINRMSTTHCM